MKRLRPGNGGLDTVDTSLLQALARDARTTTADLARAVGLSAPSVAERMRRLEDAGVIAGYGVDVNPKALGYGIAAYVRVRPVPGQLHRVADLLQQIDDVVECDRVTGDDCFIARVQVASVADLEAVIDRLIPYAMTNSSIVQSTPVKKRLPPLPRAARRD
ncbi:Lrp/AsnC family transcriptional regulator [Marinivivus vitaminiproducens]|uniref:Lrp/AsnC family transcriptional regulator n=1 Tax=Marinivivus vitaminiproducens TaxID=3035935 RepID=UPI00279B3A49|nr:Lrp/AsnC family transcriptional regulator [Geminicoccaceae bacterium SCSIO 64248]